MAARVSGLHTARMQRLMREAWCGGGGAAQVQEEGFRVPTKALACCATVAAPLDFLPDEGNNKEITRAGVARRRAGRSRWW